jgi:predicted ATP-grasp superfamily ATP-dependent carboligase
VLSHPDTAMPVVGMRVPHWQQVLDMSRRVSQAVGLGYIGVDIVVDAEEGPMLLEANARPGLAIQIANACGLMSRLAEIDDQINRPTKQKPKVSPIADQSEPLRKSA